MPINPNFEALVSDLEQARSAEDASKAIALWRGYADELEVERNAARDGLVQAQAAITALQGDLARAQEALRQSEAARDQLKQAHETLTETNIWNYAEKAALRKALSLFDESHPLLEPTSGNPLISNLRRQAMQAYVFSNGSLDEVNKMARLFKYMDANPSRPARGLLEAYQGHRQALENALERMNDPALIESARRAREIAARQPR